MRDPEVRSQIESQLHAIQNNQTTGCQGVILQYFNERNSATVLLSRQNSNLPGEVLNSVPCPYIPGLQYAAPEPGRMCWVEFRGDNHNTPVITHFFNSNFQNVDYEAHSDSRTNIPKFMIDM